MHFRLQFTLCALLTALSAWICMRTEQLNARADGYLPRTDFGNYNRKWRVAADVAKLRSLERQVMLERETYLAEHPRETLSDAGEFMDAPLTAKEKAFIDRGMEKHRAHVKLAKWITSAGLWQYLLAPRALFWSLRIVASKHPIGYRVAAVLFAIVAATSCFLMVYRGYFSSLGLLT